MSYGKPPTVWGEYGGDLTEMMYYLYLPVMMNGDPYDIRLPPNVSHWRTAIRDVALNSGYKYAYISARKGWATPDAPLNRPGWHCDGFGTDDMNYVWWRGPGTRFLVKDDKTAKLGAFDDISPDHKQSMHQFASLAGVFPNLVTEYPEGNIYQIDPYVIHATPIISGGGCMRQYVKISLSNHQYNLADNSHNYLFDYKWEMVEREPVRNDTFKAQRDYA